MNRVLFALLLAVLVLPSCFSISVGTKDKPSRLQMDGFGRAYIATPKIEKFNGTILKAGLFEDSSRDDEIASLDIWPLGGVGVGLLGARVRVLFFEVGAGILFYKPRPPIGSAPAAHEHAPAEPAKPKALPNVEPPA